MKVGVPIIVSSEDYFWVYMEGKLFSEGHSLAPLTMYKLGQEYPDVPPQEVRFYPIKEEYLEEHGDLPQMFTDIPREAFSWRYATHGFMA